MSKLIEEIDAVDEKISNRIRANETFAGIEPCAAFTNAGENNLFLLGLKELLWCCRAALEPEGVSETPKAEWKVETEKGPWDARVPTSFRLKVGSFKLSIHHCIGMPPEIWMASCDRVFRNHVLKSTDPDEAKAEALELLRTMLTSAMAELPGAPTREGSDGK